MNTEKLKLQWGCSRALPDGTRYAWGARMIAPADVLWDRTALAGGETGDVGRDTLVEWLNDGALLAARERARQLRLGVGSGAGSQDITTLYQDDRGQIDGSPQGSYGYVYVVGYLYEHLA